MPLTYPKDEGQTLHLWLNKVREEYPDEAEVKALCGGVHVFAGKDDLVSLEELAADWAGEEVFEDVEDLLDRGPICSQCGDQLRERLNLTRRDLTDIPGIGRLKAESLHRAGFETPEDLRTATQEEIHHEADGIGRALAARIKADVGSPPGERR